MRLPGTRPVGIRDDEWMDPGIAVYPCDCCKDDCPECSRAEAEAQAARQRKEAQ